MKRVAFAAIFTAIAFSASAQPTAVDLNEDIVVTAPADRERVRQFVTELSAPSPPEGQLARWDRIVCPGVVGMRHEFAQPVIDRISQTALRLGLRVGEPGCRANILIFYTPDSDAFARALAVEQRTLSADNRDGNTSGRAALRDFVETPRAVRWWYVSQTVTADGFPVSPSIVYAKPEERGTTRVSNMSRVSRSTRQDLDRVVIVVDANRTNGVISDALGDYLAMAAFAQLDPNADVSSAPSILNLFSVANPVQRLTDWDMSYLAGLYGARRDALSAGFQEHDIQRHMMRDLSAE